MKLVEFVLRTGRGKEGEQWRGNRCIIVSTHVNITMYTPVQILYANKFFKRKLNKNAH
jgi:hypothetical protein